MSIKNNTTDLQALLEVANNLPVAENLDTELSAQDELIAQIVGALEGKTGGGAEVVTGTFTATENATTHTIPGLKGKENFCIMCFSDFSNNTMVTGPVMHAWKLAEDSSMSLIIFYTDDGWYSTTSGASTFDSATGKITFGGVPTYKFIGGTYFYIGW